MDDFDVSNMGMGKHPLDKRMKSYEQKVKLPQNLPVIIRIDGRAFHTFTRGMDKPFDEDFIRMMNHVALGICKDMQNCRLAYVQSDEINIMMYQNPDSSAWFDNQIQKISSITASRASALATQFAAYDDAFKVKAKKKLIMFDSRCFVLPKDEVVNYYIWRQQDWERNSVQMFARAHYSHKELNNKKVGDMHEMLHQKGYNWAKLPEYLKRGRCIVKVVYSEDVDNEHFTGKVDRSKWIVESPPIFVKDRDYIKNRLEQVYTTRSD